MSEWERGFKRNIPTTSSKNVHLFRGSGSPLKEHDQCYALTRERYPSFVMRLGGKPCAGDRVVLDWQPIPNAVLFYDSTVACLPMTDSNAVCVHAECVDLHVYMCRWLNDQRLLRYLRQCVSKHSCRPEQTLAMHTISALNSATVVDSAIQGPKTLK